MKVGNRVRIKKDAEKVPLDYRNSEGIIVQIEEKCKDYCTDGYKYWVLLENENAERWFCREEMEKI